MQLKFAVDFNQLDLQKTEIYRSLGYGDAQPDEITRCDVDAIVDKANLICKPLAMFAVNPFQMKENNLLINGVELKVGKIIANYLTSSTELAVFVATAGVEYDTYLHEIKASGDIYMEFLADAVGSEIAEATVRFVSKEVEKIAASNEKFITLSYSPGYCGWHVRQQTQLFTLLPNEPCGITLNDSCLMHPVKSVSGIIGISNLRDVQVPYSCDICGMKTCYKRKK